MEGNKKKLCIGVLALVLVLALAAVVYFVFIKKDNNTQGSKEDLQAVDYDLIKAHDLLVYSGYDNTDYYSTNVVNIKDVEMGKKVGMALNSDGKDTISEETVKAKYQELFNDDYAKVDEVDNGCEVWTYDGNGNYKLKSGGGCGSGSFSDGAIDEIVSAKKIGDKLEIEAYIYIFDLYKKHELRDYTNDKVILQDASLLNENLDGSENITKFDVTQYANEFQNYKFTFVLVNDNYVLSSIEPINK